MATRVCDRHGKDYPCTCAMGNLYRFVEPIVLLLLKKKGHSYGYDLSERAAELRADGCRGWIGRRCIGPLRNLEANGNVRSEWDTKEGGPARRVYRFDGGG